MKLPESGPRAWAHATGTCDLASQFLNVVKGRVWDFFRVLGVGVGVSKDLGLFLRFWGKITGNFAFGQYLY